MDTYDLAYRAGYEAAERARNPRDIESAVIRVPHREAFLTGWADFLLFGAPVDRKPKTYTGA